MREFLLMCVSPDPSSRSEESINRSTAQVKDLVIGRSGFSPGSLVYDLLDNRRHHVSWTIRQQKLKPNVLHLENNTQTHFNFVFKVKLTLFITLCFWIRHEGAWQNDLRWERVSLSHQPCRYLLLWKHIFLTFPAWILRPQQFTTPDRPLIDVCTKLLAWHYRQPPSAATQNIHHDTKTSWRVGRQNLGGSCELSEGSVWS